jgi:hypothetical protein
MDTSKTREKKESLNKDGTKNGLQEHSGRASAERRNFKYYKHWQATYIPKFEESLTLAIFLECFFNLI